MKTLTSLVLALAAACTTDESPSPADKIVTNDKVGDDTADIAEGVSDITPDAELSDRARDRLEHGFFVPTWAEEVKISGKTLTLLHAANGETLLLANDE